MLRPTYPIEGAVFVFTGALKHFTREQAAAMVIERGGKVELAVTKRTNYLICGEGPIGTKHRTADKYGTHKRTEEWFMAAMMANTVGLVPRKSMPHHDVIVPLSAQGYNPEPVSQVGEQKTRRVRVQKS